MKKNEKGKRGAQPKARQPKRNWTMEEDAMLKLLVEAEELKGTTLRKWCSISEQMDNRTGKQCRERWHNHLHPGIKKGRWSVDEDATLFVLQKDYGNQWTKIAASLPGRTDNDVKNRYYSVMRTRAKRARKEAKKNAAVQERTARKRRKALAKTDPNAVVQNQDSTFQKPVAASAAILCNQIINCGNTRKSQNETLRPPQPCATSSNTKIVSESIKKSHTNTNETVQAPKPLRFTFDDDSQPKHVIEDRVVNSRNVAAATFPAASTITLGNQKENELQISTEEALLKESLGVDIFTPIVLQERATNLSSGEPNHPGATPTWPYWAAALFTPRYNSASGANTSNVSSDSSRETLKPPTPVAVRRIFEA